MTRGHLAWALPDGVYGATGLRVSSLRSTGEPCDASDRHFCLESCQMAAKFNNAKADWLQLMANVRGGGDGGGGGVCFESESHYYWPQPGLAWPGLVWVLYLAWSGIACQSFGVVRQPNMQTRTGSNNVAATRHAAYATRHTPQCGHRDTGKVRSLSFNSLAALTFCRVCTSQQGDPCGNTATITTEQENKKTTLWLPANSPKCHALSHSPSARHSNCHCISLILSLSLSLSRILSEIASPCPAQSACMFDELIKARARLNFKSIPFPV